MNRHKTPCAVNAQRTPSPVVVYHYRGKIEVWRSSGGRPAARWADGYSETSDSGAVLYPWMTRKECEDDAIARGAKAKFDDASAAVTKAGAL